MKNLSELSSIEKLIIRDNKFLFTALSFATVFLCFLNLSLSNLPLLGTIATLAYFLINGIFLGHAFFEKEDAFFRFMFGVLLLIMLLGFVGWLAVIIYNLDVFRFTLVLLIVATLSSLSNRRVKSKNAT